jgi:hypothetical protein
LSLIKRQIRVSADYPPLPNLAFKKVINMTEIDMLEDIELTYLDKKEICDTFWAGLIHKDHRI